MNRYAAELKKRREDSGMTVRVLAERVGRSATFIADFENKKKSNPPEPEMMDRLAGVLNWSSAEQLEAWGYNGLTGEKPNDDPTVSEIISLVRQVDWDRSECRFALYSVFWDIRRCI